MNNGFINIHRKILDSPISKKPHWAWLWVYLLLRANWEETSIIWNGENTKIARGSFVTGRNSLAKETGISASTIEDILTYLETQHQIRQQKNNKYRVITVLNWDKYQKPDIKSNNKATTKQQLADTDNNINKNNKENKNTSKTGVLQGIQWNELIDSFKDVNPMYTDFYSNKTERRALEDMAKSWGYDKLLHSIQELPKIIGQPFAPKITKPSELRRDIGKLIAFYNQEKNKNTAKKGKVAFT